MQIMNLNYFLKEILCSITLKKAIRILPDAVFLIEDNGKILWVNDKATTIFEAGKKLLKSYHFDNFVDKGMGMVEKSVSTRTPVIAGAYTPGSKEIFIELNAKRYGKNYLITIRDITAMTSVLSNAEQTNQFNREKNAMLVKLSNEIKSPINSIVGFSQALIDGLGGEINEKQDKYARIINKSSSDLLYFMDKFIEFAYAESTLYEYDFQTFDVVNTIQNVIRTNDFAILNKGLTLNFDYENLAKRAIFSDEKTVKTILQNLLDTSIKLTDTGSISIRIFYPEADMVSKIAMFDNYKEGSLVQIEITDTGIGLQETEMESLFEPYNQLDKSNKKNIVRSITLGTASILAKRLNGIVWAESEVMKGTSFNLIIPIEKDFILAHE